MKKNKKKVDDKKNELKLYLGVLEFYENRNLKI